jgi:hypothetical protein
MTDETESKQPTEYDINEAIQTATSFVGGRTWDKMRDGVIKLHDERGFYYIVDDTDYGQFEFNIITPSVKFRDVNFTDTLIEFQKWFISKLARCPDVDFIPWQKRRLLLFEYLKGLEEE